MIENHHIETTQLHKKIAEKDDDLKRTVKKYEEILEVLLWKVIWLHKFQNNSFFIAYLDRKNEALSSKGLTAWILLDMSGDPTGS